VISGLGNQLGGAAVVWMVLGLTHSPLAIGIISLCLGVPAAIVSPFAGVLGDRYSRSRLMVAGNILLAIIYAGIAAVSQMGSHWIVASYVLVATGSAITPLTSAGRSQLIAELLPAEERSAGNFFDSVYLHLTWLLGPAVAGFCVAWFGYGPVLIMDAVSFLICAGFMYTVPSALHVAGTSFRRLARNLWDGVRTVRASGLLLKLAVLTFFFNFFFGVYDIVLPLMARDNFGGAKAFGLLWTAFAVGSFVGGLLFSRRPWRLPMGSSMAVVIMLWGAFTLLLTLVHGYWMIMAIMMVNGFIYTPYEPLFNTIVQKIVPLPLQAKVSSTLSPITGFGQPTGAWLSGLLATPLGLTGLLLVSGGATVIVGWITFMTPQIRHYAHSGEADSQA
jgi:MFS family permease